jgi:plasmid replication initiation protein
MDRPMTTLIVKDNALIEASYALNVVEQRLILLAILEARASKTTIAAGTSIVISANSYIKQFSVERQTAYQVLQRACLSLFDAYFEYYRSDPKRRGRTHMRSRWVEKIGYNETQASVELAFASDVIPLITRLEASFTSYEIRQISNLDSGYAIRLYELLIRWRLPKTTPMMTIGDLRASLGVQEHQYTAMNDFKKRVLDLAINQINSSTDLTVTYEQHKRGRTITGFTFKFEVKSEVAAPELAEAAGTTSNKEKPIDAQVLSGLEKSMLKALQKTYKSLNEKEIFKMAKAQKLSPFDILKTLQDQLNTAPKN